VTPSADIAAIARDFAHVRAWVFDLDNTLYPPEAALFAQMEPRIVRFITATLGVDEAEAARLRDLYWADHGTTLGGLMALHGVDPLPYLRSVHDVDLSRLRPDPELADRIRALPGRRVVFTNGDGAYAARVLRARGLEGVFDAVYGCEHAGYRPKPQQVAFEAVFALDGLAPAEGAFFDDDPRNLAVPHALGMRTVLVGAQEDPFDHVHHRTTDLAAFLGVASPGADLAPR
jgi:putative hydrolase of the HAD superfamily